MAPDEILRELVVTLEALEIPYAIAGSIASIAYGEPRATMDIDVVMDLEPVDVSRLGGRLHPKGFVVDEEAATQAVSERRQFNILHPTSGFKIDVFVMGDDIERSQIRRRRRLPALADLEASFSPPEEVILKKLQYFEAGGSDKHLRDIAAMLEISAEEIDEEWITEQAAELGLLETWKSCGRIPGQ